MDKNVHNDMKMNRLRRILTILPPKKMRTYYKIIFYFLFIFAIFLIFLSYLSLLGCDSQAARMVQILSGLAVAVTSIIALSNADLPRKQVNVDIKQSFSSEEPYSKNEMSDELKGFYRDYPDTLKSWRVQFTMTNISGFTLVKPNVAFRVPLDKKHPHRDADEEPWSIRTFNSNLYNSLKEFRMLEFADTCVMSNSNLPYWNEKETIILWIRMVLNDVKLESFNVEVSVNCENADGFHQTVIINSSDLLKSVGEQL